jgi:hypothetical protein
VCAFVGMFVGMLVCVFVGVRVYVYVYVYVYVCACVGVCRSGQSARSARAPTIHTPLKPTGRGVAEPLLGHACGRQQFAGQSYTLSVSSFRLWPQP